MNVIYHQYPIKTFECISFLEHYLNKNNYLSILNYFNKSIDDPYITQASLGLLDQIKDEMGKVYEETHLDFSFLLNYVENKISYLHSYLIDKTDVSLTDLEKQKQHLLSLYEKDEYTFLRFVVKTEENQEMIDSYSESELLKQLDEMEISDELKWNYLKMNMQYKIKIEQLFTLLSSLYSIYDKYENKIAELLNLYEEDRNKQYEENDMFNHFIKENKLTYTSFEKEVHVFPSVANSVSFMMTTDSTFLPGNMQVLWGVFLNRGNSLRTQKMSIDEICATLKILSDKSKFEILKYISDTAAYGAQIAKEMNLTTATISYHMQYMLDKHLIEVDKINNRLYYKTNKEYISHFLQAVERTLLNTTQD